MLRLWLLGLLATCLVQAEELKPIVATVDRLQNQKLVYNLLYHVLQPTVLDHTLLSEGTAWDIEANIDSYTNPAAVKEFLYMYENGMLPRGETFSIFYPKLRSEMKALFKIFYYAKDFNTFFKTAHWARSRINDNQFVYALYNAVIRRPDTMYIQLPALHEIFPHLFFNSEVFEKANHVKILSKLAISETHVIPANYSGWYLNREYDMENKLNYFVEDIGLNNYYFFLRQNTPFWLESSEFGVPNYRGEEYLYTHKLLLDRYNLERLANDLPRIEDFSWEREFYPGYYPTMRLANGLPFPQRPKWYRFPYYKHKLIKEIESFESRISATIDSGRALTSDGKSIDIYTTPNGLDILGNLIEGNMESCNLDFYGNIDAHGRRILGLSLEPATSHQISPSALEIYSSSMRDPAFFRLYNRILSYYYRFKMHQKPYSKDEIIYPSLKVESFTVDKLITYFDQSDATISNGLIVKDATEAEKLLIKVRQYRLNHKPFSFHIAINADKPIKAAIRIFLGPKYDSHHKLMELSECLKHFYEIDNWILDLNAGLNKIVRKSEDLLFTIPDQQPSELFYKKITESLTSTQEFRYNEMIHGFPERLLLPKGRKEGLPLQLFVYVSPVTAEHQYTSRIWGNRLFDNRALGFPLDRPLHDYKYDGPNMAIKDIHIYHKEEDDATIPY